GKTAFDGGGPLRRNLVWNRGGRRDPMGEFDGGKSERPEHPRDSSRQRRPLHVQTLERRVDGGKRFTARWIEEDAEGDPQGRRESSLRIETLIERPRESGTEHSMSKVTDHDLKFG